MAGLPVSGKIRNLHIAIETEFNRQLKELGLTAVQSMVLKYIVSSEKEEINQVDIEKYLRCTNPTVTGLMKRLAEKELVICMSSKKDKRFKKVMPTEKSRQLIAYLDKRVEELNHKITAGLTEEERENLKRMLEKMEKNLTHM